MLDFLKNKQFIYFPRLNLQYQEIGMAQNLKDFSRFYDRQAKTTFTSPLTSVQRPDYLKLRTICDLIQKHYISIMVQLYHQNSSKIPNPQQMVSTLRHLYQKLEKYFTYDEPNEKKGMASNLRNSQVTTGKSLVSMTQIPQTRQALGGGMNGEQLIQRLKKAFTPFFQQHLSNSNDVIKWMTVDDRKIVETLYQFVSGIIKTAFSNLKKSSEIHGDEFSKKFMKIEQKIQQDRKDQNMANEKLNSKLKQLALQNKKLNDQRKGLEKEKNDFHIQMHKLHLEIVEKSKSIEELREKLKHQGRKIQIMEKSSSEERKAMAKLEAKLKGMEQAHFMLSQQYRAQKLMGDKLKKQLGRGQQNFKSKLSKIKSHETLKFQAEEKQQKEEKERLIKEWKALLQKTVYQMQREIDEKEAKIEGMVKQIARLKIESVSQRQRLEQFNV